MSDSPSEAECPLTELPAAQCACRNHRGGPAFWDRTETVGQPFEAAFPGVCEQCGGRIAVGQDIARVADGSGYVHAPRCAS